MEPFYLLGGELKATIKLLDDYLRVLRREGTLEHAQKIRHLLQRRKYLVSLEKQLNAIPKQKLLYFKREV